MIHSLLAADKERAQDIKARRFPAILAHGVTTSRMGPRLGCRCRIGCGDLGPTRIWQYGSMKLVDMGHVPKAKSGICMEEAS